MRQGSRTPAITTSRTGVGPDDSARNDPAVPAILGGATEMDDVFGAEDEESA